MRFSLGMKNKEIVKMQSNGVTWSTCGQCTMHIVNRTFHLALKLIQLFCYIVLEINQHP